MSNEISLSATINFQYSGVEGFALTSGFSVDHLIFSVFYDLLIY